MLHSILLIMGVIFTINSTVRPIYAAILYRAPSPTLTLMDGDSFTLACGISNLTETEERAWIRSKDGKLKFLTREGTSYPAGRYKIGLSQDYTITITDVTVSDTALYLCGISKYANKKFYFTKLATVNVTVLPVPSPTATRKTTTDASIIMPKDSESTEMIQKTPLRNFFTTSQPKQLMTENATTSMPEKHIEGTFQPSPGSNDRHVTYKSMTKVNLYISSEPVLIDMTSQKNNEMVITSEILETNTEIDATSSDENMLGFLHDVTTMSDNSGKNGKVNLTGNGIIIYSTLLLGIMSWIC